MAEQGGVLREPTEVERRNYVDIMKPAYDIEFIKLLRAKEKEYAKAMKPWCRRCARVDFDDAVTRLKLDIQRQRGMGVKVESVMDIGNFDKYGSEKRFELILESEAYDKVVIAGRRENVLVGYHVEYKCNIRGCNFSVYMPQEDYKKWKSKGNKETK